MIKARVLFALFYLSITSVCCGATYYVSPLGSDSNIGDNSNRPFKTFVRAFSVMSAGDKLTVKDGIYDSRTQPRGFATADCNAGAPNGTSGAHVTVQAENAKGETITLEGDYSLVSVGRRPYTDGLGIKELGIKTTPRGVIEVDKYFKTNIPSIR